MKLALEIANAGYSIVFQTYQEETVIRRFFFKGYAARWRDDLIVFFVSDGEGDIQLAFFFKFKKYAASIEIICVAVGRDVLVDDVGFIVNFELFQIWRAGLVVVQQVDGIILALGERDQEIAC